LKNGMVFCSKMSKHNVKCFRIKNSNVSQVLLHNNAP
jgi:hypothetical protein